MKRCRRGFLTKSEKQRILQPFVLKGCRLQPVPPRSRYALPGKLLRRYWFIMVLLAPPAGVGSPPCSPGLPSRPSPMGTALARRSGPGLTTERALAFESVSLPLRPIRWEFFLGMFTRGRAPQTPVRHWELKTGLGQIGRA